MRFKKLIALALAVGALGASIATVAQAAPEAKPLTGTWTGKTSQDIAIMDPSSGEIYESEWSVRMTMTALNGRLVSIATTVRVVCPGPGVKDLLVRKSWKVNRKGVSAGPELGKYGGFAVLVRAGGQEPVHISGQLVAGSAYAQFDSSSGGCSGKGSWKGKRRL